MPRETYKIPRKDLRGACSPYRVAPVPHRALRRGRTGCWYSYQNWRPTGRRFAPQFVTDHIASLGIYTEYLGGI